MLIDVVKVAPYPDFTLELEYANGERRQFDTTPLLTLRPWTTLATWSLFRWARVEYGTVVWPVLETDRGGVGRICDGQP